MSPRREQTAALVMATKKAAVKGSAKAPGSQAVMLAKGGDQGQRQVCQARNEKLMGGTRTEGREPVSAIVAREETLMDAREAANDLAEAVLSAVKLFQNRLAGGGASPAQQLLQVAGPVTQQGDAKLQGRKSYLEQAAPSAAALRQIKAAVARQANGQCGWRKLAVNLSKILKLSAPMSHEAARRVAAEIEMKDL